MIVGWPKGSRNCEWTKCRFVAWLMIGFRLCSDFLAEAGMRKWDCITLYCVMRLWTSVIKESDSICRGTVPLPIVTE
jgi:hypothetical protein